MQVDTSASLNLTMEQSHVLGSALLDTCNVEWDVNSAIFDDEDGNSYYVGETVVDGVTIYAWFLLDEDGEIIEEAEGAWLDAGQAEMAIPGWEEMFEE